MNNPVRASLISLILIANHAFAAEREMPPTKVTKANAEARAQISNAFFVYVDIDLRDPKTGMLSVGSIKSLSPVQCTALKSRGIKTESTKWADVQATLLHIGHHGVDLNRLPKILAGSGELWLKTRKPENFDTKAMKAQAKQINNLIDALNPKKKNAPAPGK